MLMSGVISATGRRSRAASERRLAGGPARRLAINRGRTRRWGAAPVCTKLFRRVETNAVERSSEPTKRRGSVQHLADVEVQRCLALAAPALEMRDAELWGAAGPLAADEVAAPAWTALQPHGDVHLAVVADRNGAVGGAPRAGRARRHAGVAGARPRRSRRSARRRRAGCPWTADPMPRAGRCARSGPGI